MEGLSIAWKDVIFQDVKGFQNQVIWSRKTRMPRPQDS